MKKTGVKALNGFRALSNEELEMVDGGTSWLDKLNDVKIEHGRTSVDTSGVHFNFGNCEVDIGNIGKKDPGIRVTTHL